MNKVGNRFQQLYFFPLLFPNYICKSKVRAYFIYHYSITHEKHVNRVGWSKKYKLCNALYSI